MGATNVATAYALYAGKVPPLSMQLLTYMALVSIDSDPRPWFSKGHAALAEAGMGRPLPTTEKDEHSVRRALKPLLDIGAIECDRRGNGKRKGSKTTRYRLNLGMGIRGLYDIDPNESQTGSPPATNRPPVSLTTGHKPATCKPHHRPQTGYPRNKHT